MSAVTERAALARSALDTLYGELRARGLGAPERADGQMIRPLLSIAGAQALGIDLDARFWSAAAAVQLAHEASLLHDDVIDSAAIRRSAPTVAATRGVAVALVEGDHLLTTSYRLAAATESPAFFAAFSHAVERTVAGEKLQGRSAGLVLTEAAYRRIIAGKSGELLGCALAAGAYAVQHPAASSLYILGRRMGELYQMLDDLLDYCADVDTGKPPLADYRQQRWTWPLLELGVAGFSADPGEVCALLTVPDASGTTPLHRCVQRLKRESASVRAGIAVHLPYDTLLCALLDEWHARAVSAVAAMARSAAVRRTREQLDALVPAAGELQSYFAANSRTFSFAAHAFPREFRERVSAVYAFCRVTDDIADAVTADGDASERLELWRELALRAYEGTPTGIGLLDRVMSDARTAQVPFGYVDTLIEGMRMDLRGERYATLHGLRTYSYRVAGVIGQWLTRMCGVHDPHVLERAADLGHALQLTNIARDVGEDLRLGRVYLPAALMRAVGVTEDDLRAMASGAPVSAAYRALIEGLMQHADEHYARALEATPALPPWFRRAVRIAAHVYRGIHNEIRMAGYDNLTRRARTSGRTRMVLAVRALYHGARLPTTRPAASPMVMAQRHARTALLAVLISGGAALAARLDAQPLPPAAQLAAVEQRLAAAPSDTAAQIDLVRALFFVAVDDAKAVVRGHAAVAQVRATEPALARSRAELLNAYEGAFTALEAKHGFWPHARLRAVRRGLERLDSAVAAAPHDLEIRYLRMINGFFLPSLFGRNDAVRADMDVLMRELPYAVPAYPRALHRVMTTFVLEHGTVGPERAAALRATLADTP